MPTAIAWGVARLLIALFLVACGGSEKPAKRVEKPTTDDRTTNTKPETPDRSSDCQSAQELEVETWLAVMITDPDDEIELFTTLGMILTLTDPQTLLELREAMPDAIAATHASKQAWLACGETAAVNCVALARALESTEARLDDDVWNDDAIVRQCLRGTFTLENADCALSVSDSETAKTCF